MAPPSLAVFDCIVQLDTVSTVLESIAPPPNWAELSANDELETVAVPSSITMAPPELAAVLPLNDAPATLSVPKLFIAPPDSEAELLVKRAPGLIVSVAPVPFRIAPPSTAELLPNEACATVAIPILTMAPPLPLVLLLSKLLLPSTASDPPL